MVKKKVVTLVSASIAGLVADAFSELESLGGELREWHDNLPDSLKDHRSDIDEAASSLESLSEPSGLPDELEELQVSYSPLVKRKTSRADRGGQAVYELQAASDALGEWMEENPDHPDYGDVESFQSDLDSLIGEAEGVTYPGMYA